MSDPTGHDGTLGPNPVAALRAYRDVLAEAAERARYFRIKVKACRAGLAVLAIGVGSGLYVTLASDRPTIGSGTASVLMALGVGAIALVLGALVRSSRKLETARARLRSHAKMLEVLAARSEEAARSGSLQNAKAVLSEVETSRAAAAEARRGGAPRSDSEIDL